MREPSLVPGRDTLDQILPREFVFLPNPGNAGDSFIAVATYQVFDALGRTYHVQLKPDQLEGKVVVMGGGGNLVPLYREMRRFITEALQQNARQIILLPHTVRGNEDLLRQLRPSDIICTRDAGSTQHVQAHSPARVVQIYDMSFFFDMDTFWQRQRKFIDLPTVFFNIMNEQRKAYYPMIGDDGIFWRTDGEATPQHVPAQRPSIDLSLLFQFGVQPGNAEKSLACLLKALASVSRVTTNRLHVGLAAAHLGKPTQLHDNNYGKISGVLALAPYSFETLTLNQG